MQNVDVECCAVKALLAKIEKKYYTKEKFYVILLAGDKNAYKKIEIVDAVKHMVDVCLLFGDNKRALKYLQVLLKIYKNIFDDKKLKVYFEVVHRCIAK